MQTSIFYFSGTGNCLKVARDLANELGGANVISIPKAMNEKIDFSSKSIGIVFPVYIFGMPLIVVEFIKKIQTDANKDKYFFAVATYGGTLAGALEQTAREFKKQGLKLSAGFAVKMPGNYTPLYEAIPVKKQQKMFAMEREKIKTIAQIVNPVREQSSITVCANGGFSARGARLPSVGQGSAFGGIPPLASSRDDHRLKSVAFSNGVKEGKQQKVEKGWTLFNLILSSIYKLAAPRIYCLDKDFWVNEKCNSCGICEKICPVKNIKLTDGRPAWIHKCEQCFACLQWCPQEAIQYKKSTIGRKRYRNPEVKVEDFLNQ